MAGKPRWGFHGEHPLRTVKPGRPVVQLPSVAWRVAAIGTLAVALFAIIFFRLWFLQILSGTQYIAQANDNRLRTVKVVAPRGSILDRNGTVLVDNRPGLAIGIRPMDVPVGELRPLVKRLAAVVHVPASKLRAQLVQHTGRTMAELDAHVGAGGFDLVVLQEDANRAAVSYVLEHQMSFPGVEIQKSYLRDYPLGDLAAHVLGYTGEISPDQLKMTRYTGYAAGDVIGQLGVENTYDRWLRGRDGSLRVEVDAMGKPKRTVAGGRLPQPGDNLMLTLDGKVQRAAQDALLYGINLAHGQGFRSADAGAAVVMDVHSGAILAMASYPTYDPKVWVGGISTKAMKYFNEPSANQPLLNRADQGTYPVGSTFKAIDSVAALEEGVITPGTTFTCTGSYRPPHVLGNALWKDWSYPAGHGTIDLTTALAESCDVYFYNVGYAFYGRKGTELEDWAKRLGLGHPTGLDIPGEYAGVVPTPDWLKRTFTNPVDKIWKPGNSINLAIGQGYLLATPLQMAVAYAAIANDGAIVQPHLGAKIVAADGKLVYKLTPAKPRQLDISTANLEVIRRGLRLAASAPIGTSAPVFAGYPVAVAGKTGTAQVAGKSDYSWYVSYAPADHPQYVVAVMIEQGGHGGTAAAPAARRIYDALFHVRGDKTVQTGHAD